MAAVGGAVSVALVAVSPRRSSFSVAGEEVSSLFFGQRCGLLLLRRRRRVGACADHLQENLPPSFRSSGHVGGKTLYDLLGIALSATPEQIKSAYRHKALHVHPDVVPDDAKDEATQSFKEIRMAYQILSDRQQRAAYDLKLRFLHRTPISTPTPSQWGFISVPNSNDDGGVTFRGRKNWDSDMFS